MEKNWKTYTLLALCLAFPFGAAIFAFIFPITSFSVWYLIGTVNTVLTISALIIVQSLHTGMKLGFVDVKYVDEKLKKLEELEGEQK